MTTKKMACLRLAPETLRALLRLPDEAEVVVAGIRRGWRGVVEITVEGVGWETPDGHPIVCAIPAVITRHHEVDGTCAIVSVDWNLP